MMRLETIYNVEKYRTDLHTKIDDLEVCENYLKLMVAYFQENNITEYNKFDKRDITKIKDCLEKYGFECYYENCQDNVYVSFEKNTNTGNCEIYLVHNNKRLYDIDLRVYRTSWVDDSKRFDNVQEQTLNRLEYVHNRLVKLYELQANFDNVISTYNDKVRELKTLIDSRGLKELLDIYIYAD